MKHRQIITACGFALSLVLFAFTLGSCELFPKDPPQLIIKNESLGGITSVEFWEETPEVAEIGMEAAEACLKMFIDPIHMFEHLIDFTALSVKYELAVADIVKTTPPVLKDTAAIPYDGSRSYELDTDKSYAARVNGDDWSHVSLSNTRDTIYVFNGDYLRKKE
ncbi:MAG: hypothetical protein LBK61_07645 [Spirochaetaceae bacterium]|jgi:hypothetical protein|nr:hypothetical protein [Spirochaetaceae bacterium]